MYEILAMITKYVLAVVIYVFIFKIVRLIALDIKAVTAGENAAAMLPHLKLLASGAAGGKSAVTEVFPLTHPVTTIGRSAKCGIVLADLYVSSEHARIERNKERFYIEDMKSANGTLVNNAPLGERRELKDGDRIALGGAVLMFSEGNR